MIMLNVIWLCFNSYIAYSTVEPLILIFFELPLNNRITTIRMIIQIIAAEDIPLDVFIVSSSF